MEIKPLRENVVVKVSRSPKKEIDIMPVDEPLEQGTVIAVGPQAENINPGDVVLIGKYGGATVHRSETEVLLIMKHFEVLAKLENL